MTNHKAFDTGRLFIKPTSEEDAGLIFELLNTPKWLEYIGDRDVKTVESARDYIKNKILPQLKRLGYSNYTLIRKSDNVKIGTCGLFDRDGLEGIDIGFALLPEYERKGYAFELLSAAQTAGSEYIDLHEFITHDVQADQEHAVLDKFRAHDLGDSQRVIVDHGLCLGAASMDVTADIVAAAQATKRGILASMA